MNTRATSTTKINGPACPVCTHPMSLEVGDIVIKIQRMVNGLVEDVYLHEKCSTLHYMEVAEQKTKKTRRR